MRVGSGQGRSDPVRASWLDPHLRSDRRGRPCDASVGVRRRCRRRGRALGGRDRRAAAGVGAGWHAAGGRPPAPGAARGAATAWVRDRRHRDAHARRPGRQDRRGIDPAPPQRGARLRDARTVRVRRRVRGPRDRSARRTHGRAPARRWRVPHHPGMCLGPEHQPVEPGGRRSRAGARGPRVRRHRRGRGRGVLRRRLAHVPGRRRGSHPAPNSTHTPWHITGSSKRARSSVPA